jgi:hypothetical protein
LKNKNNSDCLSLQEMGDLKPCFYKLKQGRTERHIRSIKAALYAKNKSISLS